MCDAACLVRHDFCRRLSCNDRYPDFNAHNMAYLLYCPLMSPPVSRQGQTSQILKQLIYRSFSTQNVLNWCCKGTPLSMWGVQWTPPHLQPGLVVAFVLVHCVSPRLSCGQASSKSLRSGRVSLSSACAVPSTAQQ